MAPELTTNGPSAAEPQPIHAKRLECAAFRRCRKMFRTDRKESAGIRRTAPNASRHRGGEGFMIRRETRSLAGPPANGIGQQPAVIGGVVGWMVVAELGGHGAGFALRAAPGKRVGHFWVACG